LVLFASLSIITNYYLPLSGALYELGQSMFKPQRTHLKFPKIIGFVFVCIGVLIGYPALEVVLDPNATVIVNGIERQDMEAKIFALLIPILLIIVGIVLSLSNGSSISSFNKLRDEIYSGIFGK